MGELEKRIEHMKTKPQTIFKLAKTLPELRRQYKVLVMMLHQQYGTAVSTVISYGRHKPKVELALLGEMCEFMWDMYLNPLKTSEEKIVAEWEINRQKRAQQIRKDLIL